MGISFHVYAIPSICNILSFGLFLWLISWAAALLWHSTGHIISTSVTHRWVSYITAYDTTSPISLTWSIYSTLMICYVREVAHWFVFLLTKSIIFVAYVPHMFYYVCLSPKIDQTKRYQFLGDWVKFSIHQMFVAPARVIYLSTYCTLHIWTSISDVLLILHTLLQIFSDTFYSTIRIQLQDTLSGENSHAMRVCPVTQLLFSAPYISHFYDQFTFLSFKTQIIESSLVACRVEINVFFDWSQRNAHSTNVLNPLFLYLRHKIIHLTSPVPTSPRLLNISIPSILFFFTKYTYFQLCKLQHLCMHAVSHVFLWWHPALPECFALTHHIRVLHTNAHRNLLLTGELLWASVGKYQY